MGQWATILVPSILGGGGVWSVIQHILRSPRVNVVRLGEARWGEIYKDGRRAGIEVVASVWLSNKGGTPSSVEGFFLIPGTCFGKNNPCPTDDPVVRIDANTSRQEFIFRAIIPFYAFEVDEPSKFPLTLQVIPIGQKRFVLFGQLHREVSFMASYDRSLRYERSV